MPSRLPVTERRAEPTVRPTLRGHLAVLRIDHWIKNVFVLPGIVIALAVERPPWDAAIALRIVAGLLSVGLVASSNYVLNEILDAPYDRLHPVKRSRPVPTGEVNIPLAYVQWVVVALAGLAVGAWISREFAATVLALWIMGCLYNIPPVRTKDRPFVDVLTEAINNPIRLLAGWFIVGPREIPSSSLVIAYWMIGCYLMALKRLAEYHTLGSGEAARLYRRSFGYYNDTRLLVSVMFYASAAMLFFGAFMIRYRMELIISFPLVALFMALYLRLALKPESPVQTPELLYRSKSIMITAMLCAVAITALLFVDVPILYTWFTPTFRITPAP